MAGKINKTSYSIPGGNVKQLQYNDTGLFGGCAQLFWNSANNCLGVNVVTPARKFEVLGTAAQIISVFKNTSAIAGRVGIMDTNTTADSMVGFGATGNSLSLYAGGSKRITITSAGLVGINTSTTNETLNVSGAIRLGTSALTNNGTIRWNGSDFQGYMTGWKSLTVLNGLNEIFTTQGDLVLRGAANPERLAAGTDTYVLTSNGAGIKPTWQAAASGNPGGADTQVQFNDSGAFGGDTGLVFNKTLDKLTVGVHWDAGYPFDSYQPALEGISQIGEWGVLGASRSSDYGSTGSMRCLGLYGFVQNNSNTGAYGLYVEARKTVSIPSAATLGAEIVILNRYNSQVDVTPTSNPAQSTYGLSLTSGVTYDAVQDYDASVGLYFGHVGAKFRRGIVMSNAALRDHGSSKYIAMLLPSSARICWVNDNNCIVGNATDIDTLIANSIITQVTSAGFGVTGNIIATANITAAKVTGGNAYIQNNAIHLDANDVVVSAGSNSMYFAAGGTTQAILYTTTGNFAIGGLFQENQWTLDIEGENRKWDLLNSIMGAYKAHSGENLDKMLKTENNGRRPSDFIQVAIECIAELHKRIEVLENG